MEQQEVLDRLGLLERMIQINPLPKGETTKLDDLRYVQGIKDLVMKGKKPWKHEYDKCDELFFKWGGKGFRSVK